MTKQRTAYELSRSQVSTPPDVVRIFWRITSGYRERIGRILDLGAGDGRFALGGNFDAYEGIEIDATRSPLIELPISASIVHGCAFEYDGGEYDACIGNPPYVRHHDLDRSWRDTVASRLEAEVGVAPNRKGNLYLYFMFLALVKAASDGLVATIIPYEWVSRPSAKPLRDYISRNGWAADIYRFSDIVFDGVLTTAAITVIDKSRRTGEWSFYRIDRQGNIGKSKTATGSRYAVLSYEQRGHLWAMRGMSPGTQKVFTLTEGERIHAGLTTKDVVPCVTSLRGVPSSLTRLTQPAFSKWFVDAGAKCWLIRSHEDRMSARLKAYLYSIPKEARATSTCTERTPWYRFRMFDTPRLLVSTGFTSFGPKVLINSVGAKAVGSVCGVYSSQSIRLTQLRDYLCRTRFEERVVSHAKQLKKIEIRQMNAVLNTFIKRELADGESYH